MPVFRSLSLFLAFIFAGYVFPSIAETSSWRSYPPLNDIYAFAPDNGNIWWATTGGAVKWDTTADTYQVFTPKEIGSAERFVSMAGHDGVFWFGCMNGRIMSFDGTSWTVHRELENDGKPIRVAAAGSSDIWFAAGSGAVRLRDGGWTRFGSAEGFTNAKVNAIASDEHGTVWFGTAAGLYRFDGATWTRFTEEPGGLLSNSVYSLAIDDTGTLWTGTSLGFSSFDGKQWVSHTLGDGIPSSTVTTIAPAPNGVLWIGTRAGLIRFEGGDTTRFTPENSNFPDTIVRAVSVDPKGSVWVATGDTYKPSTPKNGASRFDGSSWRNVRVPSIGGESVLAVAKDREGCIWFATENDYGVSRYDGSTWRTWSSKDGLPFNSVRTLLPDAKGNMWFGTAGGAVMFDGVSWRTYTTADGLISNNIYAAALDSSGTVWFGTEEGPCSFDNREWKSYPESAIISVAVDQRNVKWFGTPLNGLIAYDGATWKRFTKTGGLSGNRVNALAVDCQSVLWAGTGAWTSQEECGVCAFDGSGWTVYRSFAEYPHTIVTGIAVDPANRKWFASEYSPGVSVFDDKGWIRYESPWGDGFRCITLGGDGNVWLGGKGFGAACLSPGGEVDPSRIHESGSFPREIRISGIHPNPFNASVTISFDIAVSRAMTVVMYDITGRTIRTLLRDHMTAGSHVFTWNGRDDAGRPAASGVYIVRVASGPHEAYARMILLK